MYSHCIWLNTACFNVISVFMASLKSREAPKHSTSRMIFVYCESHRPCMCLNQQHLSMRSPAFCLFFVFLQCTNGMCYARIIVVNIYLKLSYYLSTTKFYKLSTTERAERVCNWKHKIKTHKWCNQKFNKFNYSRERGWNLVTIWLIFSWLCYIPVNILCAEQSC